MENLNLDTKNDDGFEGLLITVKYMVTASGCNLKNARKSHTRKTHI